MSSKVVGVVLGERVVAHQGNGLDGVGDAVGLAVVGDGLDGDVGELTLAWPRSTGATTPLETRAPSLSWAMTIRSGPLPVGTWVVNSVSMSDSDFWTTLTARRSTP